MNEPEVTALRARVEVLEQELDNLQDRYNVLMTEMGLTLDVPMCLGLTTNEGRILSVLLIRPVAFRSTLMAALYADRVADDDTRWKRSWM